MKAVRAVGRFLLDWRNVATLCASALIVMLAFTVVDGASSRRQALRVSQAQALQALSAQQAATARITELRSEIATLQTQAEANGALIAQLGADVDALDHQIRQAGGHPVVTAPTTTTTIAPSPPRTAPTTTTTTTRPGATTTTTGPRSTTTTQAPLLTVPTLPPR